MTSFAEAMNVYREQLAKGAIQIAYKGLMDYFLELRTCLKNKYPDYFVSGSLYYGYMDMTYFSFTPKSLQERSLKIAIVFNYQAFRFEAWLAAANRQVQHKYWRLFSGSPWPAYRVTAPAPGVDSIMACNLAEDFSFDDLRGLTARIMENTAGFIHPVERFLADHDTP
jgi:hypothetical protein